MNHVLFALLLRIIDFLGLTAIKNISGEKKKPLKTRIHQKKEGRKK